MPSVGQSGMGVQPSRSAQRRRRKKLLESMSPEQAEAFRISQGELRADVSSIKKRAARKTGTFVGSSPKEEDRH